MAFRQWFRPPRHVLTIFLSVAVVSAGALGWLAWLLVEQDRALEVQRRQEAAGTGGGPCYGRHAGCARGSRTAAQFEFDPHAGVPSWRRDRHGWSTGHRCPSGRRSAVLPGTRAGARVTTRTIALGLRVVPFRLDRGDVADLLRHFPLTFDLSAWTSSSAVPAVLMIAALTAYGFKVSLAGRPAFKDLLADA